METRANYATIGLFALAVIAAGFAFVYWLARYDEVGERKPLMIVFEGAVTGLAKGGQVLFNGIPVGMVTDLRIDPDNPARVIVTTAVDANAPIKADTKASLGFSALTGVSYVQLAGGSPNLPNVLASAGMPMLVGERSGLIDITESAGALVANANEAVARLNQILDRAQPSIERSVANVETFTDAIAANADGIDRFLGNVSELSENVDALSGRLAGLVDNANQLVVAVEPDRVRSILANADTLAANAANASANVDEILARAQKAADDVSALTGTLDARLTALTEKFDTSLDRFVSVWDTEVGGLRADIAGSIDSVATEVNAGVADLRLRLDDTIATLTERADGAVAVLTEDARTALASVSGGINGSLDALLARLDTSLDGIDRVVAAVDVPTINAAVANVGDFARVLGAHSGDIDAILASARTAADDVSRFTADIRARQPDIDAAITDARELADRLNAASTKVGSILDQVDDMLTGADGQGFFQEATAAAHSIRVIAQQFEGQAGTIAGGFSRFSTRGLDDLTALISDARQTLQRFDRVGAQLERDPGQIIFGGSSGVRDYNRR